MLVASKLGLSPTVDSTLLQGVGCSGRLSLMRATMLSDGAAAFVLCNDRGREGLARGTGEKHFQLLEWKNWLSLTRMRISSLRILMACDHLSPIRR